MVIINITRSLAEEDTEVEGAAAAGAEVEAITTMVIITTNRTIKDSNQIENFNSIGVMVGIMGITLGKAKAIIIRVRAMETKRGKTVTIIKNHLGRFVTYVAANITYPNTVTIKISR